MPQAALFLAPGQAGFGAAQSHSLQGCHYSACYPRSPRPQPDAALLGLDKLLLLFALVGLNGTIFHLECLSDPQSLTSPTPL